MDEFWTRFFENMVDRVTGPMKFRCLMQPLMASIFAIRSGLADARTGKPPYLATLVSSGTADRRDLLKDGWKSVGKVFVIALVLDIVYQIIVQRFVYPGETIVTALILAIVPYIVLRGLTARLAAKKK